MDIRARSRYPLIQNLGVSICPAHIQAEIDFAIAELEIVGAMVVRLGLSDTRSILLA
jgi:hypothetical protein